MMKGIDWNRTIVIICVLLLMGLLGWLAYAYGGIKVCNQMEGRQLDENFQCVIIPIEEYNYTFVFPNSKNNNTLVFPNGN